MKFLSRCGMDLTARGQVANCIPLVSPEVKGQAQLPERLKALGWKRALHVRGTLPDDQPSVAIVGARAATHVAMQRALRIAQSLAASGVHVVSGGALGIDGAAHRGALIGGGTTTVVLGTGVDVPYPLRHARLFDQVLEAGGALVSMLPDGTPPRPGTFPQRNPLIAALVDAVIVVEADIHSGSLSTARAAARFGRVVAAWPGSRGCDLLLGQGAAIVESDRDAALAVSGTPRYRPVVALDPVAAQVRAAIESGDRDVDAIVGTTGLSVRAVLRALPAVRGAGSEVAVARDQ